MPQSILIRQLALLKLGPPITPQETAKSTTPKSRLESLPTEILDKQIASRLERDDLTRLRLTSKTIKDKVKDSYLAMRFGTVTVNRDSKNVLNRTMKLLRAHDAVSKVKIVCFKPADRCSPAAPYYKKSKVPEPFNNDEESCDRVAKFLEGLPTLTGVIIHGLRATAVNNLLQAMARTEKLSLKSLEINGPAALKGQDFNACIARHAESLRNLRLPESKMLTNDRVTLERGSWQDFLLFIYEQMDLHRLELTMLKADILSTRQIASAASIRPSGALRNSKTGKIEQFSWQGGLLQAHGPEAVKECLRRVLKFIKDAQQASNSNGVASGSTQGEGGQRHLVTFRAVAD